MRISTITLAFFFATTAYSQSTVFAPKGAVWHQTPYRNDCNPVVKLFSYTADDDTIIAGWGARVVHCNEVKFGGTTQVDSLTRYISVQGDKVYWWVGGQFVTLFDFGAKPGDTISSMVGGFHVQSGCGTNLGSVLPFKYRINSVGTTVIDGQTLRTQFVSTLYQPGGDLYWGMGPYDELIVERIGAMNTTHWYGTGGYCVLAGCLSFIRCYADSDIQYQNPKWQATNKDCDFTSAISESVRSALKILPNPASDFVELPFNPDKVRLSNTLGQVSEGTAFGQNLDVSKLTTGIWVLFLEKDGQWFSTKFSVQR